MPGISILGVSAWPTTGSSQASSLRQTPGQSTPLLPPRGRVSVSPFVTFPLTLRNWPALFAPVANPMRNRPSLCIDRRIEEEDASGAGLQEAARESLVDIWDAITCKEGKNT